MRPAIELFGATWCGPCAKVKEVILGTNPAGHGVTYTYVDVGEDPEYAMKMLPVVFVGDEVMEGPSLAQVSAALDRLYDAIDAAKPAPPEPVEPVVVAPPNGAQLPAATQVDMPSSGKWAAGAVFFVLGFVGHEVFRPH